MTNRHGSATPAQRLSQARLCLLLDDGAGDIGAAVQLAQAAARGGVDVVQIRIKGAEASARARRIELCRRLARAAFVRPPLLIVNDDLDAALTAGADGVHLGQDDLAVEAARRRAPAGFLVGLSTHSHSQAAAARARGADYVGIGAMFSTATKPGTEVVGPGLLAGFSAVAGLPYFAIGGITEQNIGALVRLGCGRAAVASAIAGAANPEQAARRIRAVLEQVPLTES